MENKIEEKQKRVKKELKKLKQVFSCMEESKKKATESILQNIAFLIVELEDLQKEIQEKGATEIYNNGRQVCTKASACMSVYNNTMKTFTSSAKVLLAQLDTKEAKEAQNSLVNFIAGK